MEIEKNNLDDLLQLAGHEEPKEKSYEERIKDAFMRLTYRNPKDWDNATELLVEYIKKKIYIYTTRSDTKSETWIYKEGIYVPEGKAMIKEMLRKVLDEAYSQFVFNRVMDKIEPDTHIDADEFFATNYKWEIPVLNGILNIQTLELSPFDPEKIFFSKINAEHILGQTCPNIDQFLRDVLAQPEDIDVFYEMTGFCLLKEYTYEKAFMMVGDGRNGKGKSIELLKRLLGPENCCSIPLTGLVPESFEISYLYNKMANLAGDIGSRDLKDPSMFKSLTGRDLVSGKRKFLHPISFENYAKFVFACNKLPMVYDMSRGFWDRWVLLEYPFTFVSQKEYDSTIDTKLLKIRDPYIIENIVTLKEMSGFLNMALLGLNRLIQNGRFSQTQGTEEVKSTWIRKSNSFVAFCNDHIEEDREGILLKADLRKRFTDYCKAHKLVNVSPHVIKRTLEENYGVWDDKRKVFGRGEEYHHVWISIKMKD